MNKLIKFCLIGMILFYGNSVFAAQTSSLSYHDTGNGKPLVLIHAFPTDLRLWQPQEEGLKSHFRVITLDLSGFGQAKATDGQAITMTEYANEVKQLLDQLHIQKAIIGGESMGGYVALAFLKQYPDSVEGLVLSDTQSIADTPEAKAKREATALAILADGSSQFIQDFMPKALTESAAVSTRSFLKTILESQSPKGMASALRGMALRDDTSSVLANTRVPILIITGDQDTLILPKQSQQMHALARNSRLVTIENAGHLSNLEQPTQWNQAVMDSFKSD